MEDWAFVLEKPLLQLDYLIVELQGVLCTTLQLHDISHLTMNNGQFSLNVFLCHILKENQSKKKKAAISPLFPWLQQSAGKRLWALLGSTSSKVPQPLQVKVAAAAQIQAYPG